MQRILLCCWHKADAEALGASSLIVGVGVVGGGVVGGGVVAVVV